MAKATEKIRIYTNEGRDGERLIAIFCLGVVLFSPALIGVFDVGPEVSLFGLPLLVFYLFAAWTMVIFLLFVTMRNIEQPDDAPGEGQPSERDR